MSGADAASEARLFEPEYTGALVAGKMESDEDAQYTFPSGTKYVGTFKNGAFHGKGVLIFPGKGEYRGEWRDGELLHGNYTYEDGLRHEETAGWYCTKRDRRYFCEHKGRMPAAGASFIRGNDQPIPSGAFDCADGYLDDEEGVVRDYETHEVVREPTPEQLQIIRARAYQEQGQDKKKHKK